MKIFILIFILLFSGTIFAQLNWVSVSKWKSHSKVYTNQGFCESTESDNCIDKTGIDIRRWKLVLVDDLDRPIFRASKDSPVLLDCDDFDNCSSKATNPDDDSLTDDNVCLADDSQPRWDELVNHPDVTGLTGPWFIWCEKETGSFQKKHIIVADPGGSTDADAEDLKITQDNDKRRDARETSESSLLQCFQDTKNPTVSPIQIKDCLKAIAMEVLGDKIPIEQID